MVVEYQHWPQTYHPFHDNPDLHLTALATDPHTSHGHDESAGGGAPQPPPFSLRLATFNILAQDYAAPGSMKHVKPHLLNWDHGRARMVCDVLRRLNADMVCLQEVDRLDSLADTLRELGYAGYQTNRPCKLDTCVMYYKLDR